MLAPVTEADYGEAALLSSAWRPRPLPGFAPSSADRLVRHEAGTLVRRPRPRRRGGPRPVLAFHATWPRGRAPAPEPPAASSPRSRPPSASRSTSPATARSTRGFSSPPRAPSSARRRAPHRGGGTRGRATAPRLRRRRGARPDTSLLATGAGASTSRARVPVRPVKGQVLRLRDPHGPGLVTGRSAGATATSSRARTAATSSAPRWRSGARRGGDGGRRLRAAARPVRGRPRCARARGRGAARRPAPRHARQPAGDRARRARRLLWATGHFRNGILLAPVTAELAVAHAAGRRCRNGPRPPTRAGSRRWPYERRC